MGSYDFLRLPNVHNQKKKVMQRALGQNLHKNW